MTATHAFALPTDRGQDATIDATIRGVDGSLRRQHWTFQRDRGAFGQWVGNRGRPPKAGVVVYARADGGVSVWDPAQNYFRPSSNTQADFAADDEQLPTDVRQHVRDAIERFDTLSDDERQVVSGVANSRLRAGDPVNVQWRAKHERRP